MPLSYGTNASSQIVGRAAGGLPETGGPTRPDSSLFRCLPFRARVPPQPRQHSLCIVLCIVAANLFSFAAILLLVLDPTQDLALVFVLLALGVVFAAVPRFLRRRR
jgi:hypothetical protein